MVTISNELMGCETWLTPKGMKALKLKKNQKDVSDVVRNLNQVFST